ncbi:hypothetical protein [Methanolapillus millepedarum]|uniref:hypothetical protein n=1 Tax=Methanolapillus millepedarum TaxID=3028296 RepID=UPI0030B90F78
MNEFHKQLVQSEQSTAGAIGTVNGRCNRNCKRQMQSEQSTADAIGTVNGRCNRNSQRQVQSEQSTADAIGTEKYRQAPNGSDGGFPSFISQAHIINRRLFFFLSWIS